LKYEKNREGGGGKIFNIKIRHCFKIEGLKPLIAGCIPAMESIPVPICFSIDLKN